MYDSDSGPSIGQLVERELSDRRAGRYTSEEAEDVVITVIPAMHLGQSPMLLILVTKSNTPQGERGVGATARRMIENQL